MKDRDENTLVINQGLDSYFASPERSSDKTILEQVNLTAHNPVVDGVMKTVSGVLAVLNEHRQVVSVNEEFFKKLGLDKDENILGLRPGEAIKCIHADEMDGGCGTSKYCASCGAAVAIVLCLKHNEPAERKCIVKVKRNGQLIDLCLNVRACPISFSGQKFVLLVMNDSSNIQRWANLERVFFHDLQNMLCGIIGKAQLIKMDLSGEDKHVEQLLMLARRIAQEIDIHKKLFDHESFDYQPVWDEVMLNNVLAEVRAIIADHEAAADKVFECDDPVSDLTFTTDVSLLLRILCNMAVNALENSEPKDKVKFWTDTDHDKIEFHVWNNSFIPESVALRIFDKNFTTKSHAGHGFGTYSMKFFGEKVLSGNISFTTNSDTGTEFIYKLYL